MIFGLARKTAPGSRQLAQLAGRRVFLRPPARDDYKAWAAVRGKNESFLAPWEPTWPESCLSESFFLRRLARQERGRQTDRAYSFLVFKNGPEEDLIGGVNINNVCRGAAQFASLGYWLDEEAQGHGYMHEALELAIEYGFDALRLHRLNAGCLPHNERSIKLLRGLGFTEEGRAAKYLRIAGAWQDHILFGLNVDDWK